MTFVLYIYEKFLVTRHVYLFSNFAICDLSRVCMFYNILLVFMILFGSFRLIMITYFPLGFILASLVAMAMQVKGCVAMPWSIIHYGNRKLMLGRNQFYKMSKFDGECIILLKTLLLQHGNNFLNKKVLIFAA